MTSKKYYTVEQVEKVKEVLEELPDLKKMRLTKDDVLDNLKAQITKLALNKGYVSEDIKSALESAEIKVGLKSIQKIILEKKLERKKSLKNT
ncbi:molybdopterin-guanine dinucleotide biosynthesis protein MobC [Candidatus Williamhamiltonella defendens]|uniref:molybdopterin-guanine dinucleotide biosynthesis protein MobC n=1 Tax=Candidatus Williamhamiltonella defendens TaxID=138072 RepID=UPI001583FF89|nr:molybdopterin-guanine dinucleotide biosynthesis protein MobC [Candidatus Hamiltonella defensa]